MEGVIYNTPMNTIGVGDPVPFGIGNYGSGDLFGSKKQKKGKGKQTIAVKKPAYGAQLPLIVMAKK